MIQRYNQKGARHTASCRKIGEARATVLEQAHRRCLPHAMESVAGAAVAPGGGRRARPPVTPAAEGVTLTPVAPLKKGHGLSLRSCGLDRGMVLDLARSDLARSRAA